MKQLAFIVPFLLASQKRISAPVLKQKALGIKKAFEVFLWRETNTELKHIQCSPAL